jgi:dinuclear metal center YbgI/SA1388 family protein
MKISEIYSFLDNLSPFSTQEKWDNSGLNIGSQNDIVERVYLSLDVDIEMMENIEPHSLIITHHPLIFTGLKELDYTFYPANIIKIMIQKNISLIAMHTNFDKSHLNKFVFENILGFAADKNDDFVATCKGDWNKEELMDILQNKLLLEYIKVVNPKDKISSLAMITGSGASFLDHITADCFLTGDIKYHDAMKAKSQNLMMIDIGHYESERFFVDCIATHLKLLPILGIISNSKNPFSYSK